MLNRLIEELSGGWKIIGYEFEEGLARGAYKEDFAPVDYTPGTVPTTVRNALLESGKIDDPCKGMNSFDSLWVENREWWFINDFSTPARSDEQRVILRFEGITYRAEVWVNGIQAGRIEGMFRTDEFDITEYLNSDSNRLTLRIRTQENAAKDIYDSGLKGGVFSGVIRTQAPVAQNMSYWNWCQHMVAVGIWRPVKLLLRSDIALKQTVIRTLNVDLQDKDGFESPCANAELELSWRIKNNSSQTKKIAVSYQISGETFEGTVASGTAEAEVLPNSEYTITQKLKIATARLWWPNGLGNAELHKINSVVTSNAGEIQNNEELFGIRTVSFLPNEDEDWVRETSKHSTRPWSMIGDLYKWTFVINGRKVFLKGSNWVIADAMLRLERNRYEQQIEKMKHGGMNFLRIWGGSLAETDEFFDVCNRMGIMCWQEFWLACGNYPAMNHDVFLKCAEDTVQRLINHPSLIYYSGGNEYEPDNRENKVLVDKIAAVVDKIDPDREFRRGSPYKGDKHGGLLHTPFVTRNKYHDILYGDSRIVLFRSEVAVGRSTPVLSHFEKIVPPEKRWPLDDAYWKHFFAIPAEMKMIAHEYDASDSLISLLFANWLNHALVCQYNMEYCRSQMFKCSGNLNWQLNVPWPCMHREIVDTWGQPKPAYYYQKNASKPSVAIIDLERYLWQAGELFDPEVFIAND